MNIPQAKFSSYQLITQIKSSDQDYEWYPTTNAILAVVKQDIDDLVKRFCLDQSPSVLDIGAGDGRALKALTSGEKYAIEKSKPLLSALDSNIFVVGTEFHEQTLLDKKTDVIFCNPPYSEFEQWVTKIISEARSHYIYFVIPDRWEKSERIKQVLKTRKATVEVLSHFDFLSAERKARANVAIVRVSLSESRYSRGLKTDPFDIWFDNFFDISANKCTYTANKVFVDKEKLNNELVSGGNYVSTLVEIYNKQMEGLLSTYKSIELVDSSVLSELNINLNAIKKALKLKVKNLKFVYWQELFDRMEKVTSRLTKDSRERLLATLMKNAHIDFTALNIHAILEWVVKNANKYFDQQLICIVERMTEAANIKLYKSNNKTFGKDEWRYYSKPDNLSDYALDYRVVLTRIGGIDEERRSYDKVNGLSKKAADFLDDICTIADNIGFNTLNLSRANSFEWVSGKSNTFEYRDIATGDLQPLMDVKAFKNGNLHIKFNQKFILALNVEFGRLKGWLKSKEQAAEEFEEELEKIQSVFNTNLRFESNVLLLEYNNN